jgi:hypothetical protein
MDNPTGYGKNNCWAATRLKQSSNKYLICHPTTPSQGSLSAPRWVYDDTNPTISLAAENVAISNCKYGFAPVPPGYRVSGLEFMARRSDSSCPGGGLCWRRNATGSPLRYLAEIYGPDAYSDSISYISAWLNNQSIGYPVLNATRYTDSWGDQYGGTYSLLYLDVYSICRYAVLGGHRFMGLFAQQHADQTEPVSGGAETQIVKALNDCTTTIP